MDSVSDILGNTKVHGEYHTHVSMIQPLGKFQISRSNMENFWEKYCADIEENGHIDSDSEKICYGIAEKVQTYLPVLVDIDIKIKYSEEKQYWFNPDTHVVYDLELKYPIGKVGLDVDNIPLKLSKDVYIIDKVIPIPKLEIK